MHRQWLGKEGEWLGEEEQWLGEEGQCLGDERQCLGEKDLLTLWVFLGQRPGILSASLALEQDGHNWIHTRSSTTTNNSTIQHLTATYEP